MVNDVPWRDGCLSHPLPVSNGFFEMPDRPGLGFDIDESVLLAHPGLRTRPTDRTFYI
jgi:L-alanine-DL-glutamate epimerase-like enolase superfamily enzyme